MVTNFNSNTQDSSRMSMTADRSLWLLPLLTMSLHSRSKGKRKVKTCFRPDLFVSDGSQYSSVFSHVKVSFPHGRWQLWNCSGKPGTLLLFFLVCFHACFDTRRLTQPIYANTAALFCMTKNYVKKSNLKCGDIFSLFQIMLVLTFFTFSHSRL